MPIVNVMYLTVVEVGALPIENRAFGVLLSWDMKMPKKTMHFLKAFSMRHGFTEVFPSIEMSGILENGFDP